MQNTFKRITAFAVVVCMLFCAVPMMAFAEDAEPAQLDSITYDFRKHDVMYSWNDNPEVPFGGDSTSDQTHLKQAVNLMEGTYTDGVHNPTNKATAGRERLAELYGTEAQYNWKFHSVAARSSVLSSANISSSTGSDDAPYGFYMRARAEDNSVHVTDAYFAFTVQSPGTGDYKLALNYYTHKTAAPKGSVYVMPASVTDIVSAMDYYEPVGSFTSDSAVNSFASADAEMGTVSMKAGKDYLLVFTMDEVNTSANSYLYIGDVTLDKQLPAQNLDTIAYNFDLDEDTAIGTADISRDTGATAKAAIDDYYKAGTLHWKYHSVGNRTNGTAGSWYFMFAKRSSKYDLYLCGNYKTDVFFATTIRSPGTGNYAMTLNYFTHTTGATKGSVYVLPGNTANVAAALDSAVAVGSFSCKGAANGTVNSVTFDNPVPMEAGAEYLLVFTADEYYDATATNKRANLFPSSVVMNRIVSLDEIEYDFGLGNRGETYGDNVTFSGRDLGTSSAGRTAVADRYQAETLDWKYVSGGNLSDTGTATKWNFAFGATDVNYNLSIKSSDNSAGSYFVTTIRSPGYGDYTLTLDYNTHCTGASEARIYILPADTADIAAAVNAGTAVATFSCDDQAIDDNKVLGEKTATFDVSLGMDKEYLMVFTNNATASTRDDRATIYLSGIKLTNKAAGGEEEETGVFEAEGKAYSDIKEAVRVALDDDQIITLNEDYQIDELKLLKDVSLDLNGNTLTADAYTGGIVDSSDGNTGLLRAEADAVVFSTNNADIPLYDANSGAYRFFDYTLEPWPTVEPVDTASQKFWFKFHFRVSDDEGAELDQDAYDLVAAGGSTFRISTELTWNGEALDTAFFGKDGDVDAFSKEWATGATASRWLYVVVNGLGSDMEGTLTVRPVLWANGVRITNGALSYTCSAEA